MEQVEKAQAVWEIQRQIAEKILDVNRTLSLLEAGLVKVAPNDEGLQVLEDFLTKILELEVIFYPELSSDERYREVLMAIELYRRDKEAYLANYPALIYVRYLRGSTRTPYTVFHTSREEIEQFLADHPEYDLDATRIYPHLDVLISLARAILDISLQMDLLRIVRKRLPRVILGEPEEVILPKFTGQEVARSSTEVVNNALYSLIQYAWAPDVRGKMTWLRMALAFLASFVSRRDVRRRVEGLLVELEKIQRSVNWDVYEVARGGRFELISDEEYRQVLEKLAKLERIRDEVIDILLTLGFSNIDMARYGIRAR